MNLPTTHREVISRRFELPPNAEEQSARGLPSSSVASDISRDLNRHRDKVARNEEAFMEEMAKGRGSSFHAPAPQ